MLMLYTLAAAVANNICASQTPNAGGVQALTINGALATAGVATLDAPRHVAITSAGDDSGRTFTIAGTDRYGNMIIEGVAGANTDTAKSTKNFQTITAITVDDDTAAAVTVGTADEAETPWIPLDTRRNPFNVGVGCSLAGASASMTYAMEATYGKVQGEGFREGDAVAFDLFTGKSAAFAHNQTAPVRAVRFKITGHTAGGLRADIIHAGG